MLVFTMRVRNFDLVLLHERTATPALRWEKEGRDLTVNIGRFELVVSDLAPAKEQSRVHQVPADPC